MTTQSPTPFQALDAQGTEISSGLDDLSSAIKAVEAAIRARLFKIRTRTPLPTEQDETDRHYLVWSMQDNIGWGLYLLTRPEVGDERLTPLVNAPWHLRLRATQCFDALIVQAALELRSRSREVRDAIARCESFVARISVGTNEPHGDP